MDENPVNEIGTYECSVNPDSSVFFFSSFWSSTYLTKALISEISFPRGVPVNGYSKC